MGRKGTARGTAGRDDDYNEKAGPSTTTYMLLIFLTIGGGVPLLMTMWDKLSVLTGKGVYQPLSVRYPDQLHDVFFGGSPWVVWCNENGKDHPPDGWRPHLDKLAAVALDSVDPFQVGVLDCNATLPSGKTTYSRFNITAHKDVNVILFANGQRPQFIPHNTLSSLSTKPENIVSFVSRMTTLRAPSVTSTQKLQQHCLRKKVCLVVLNYGPYLNIERTGKENEAPLSPGAATLRKIMYTHRTINYVQMDVTKTSIDFVRKALTADPNADAATVATSYPRVLVFSHALRERESEESRQATEELKRQFKEKQQAERAAEAPAAENEDEDDDDEEDEPAVSQVDRDVAELTRKLQASVPPPPLSAKLHKGAFDTSSISSLIAQMSDPQSTQSPSSTFKPAFLEHQPKVIDVRKQHKQQEKEKEKSKAGSDTKDKASGSASSSGTEKAREKPKKESTSSSSSSSRDERRRSRERERARRNRRRSDDTEADTDTDTDSRTAAFERAQQAGGAEESQASAEHTHDHSGAHHDHDHHHRHDDSDDHHEEIDLDADGFDEKIHLDL